MKRIDYLEDESIKMLKSIPQICHRPAQLWSSGKDSTTMLYLVMKAFGRVPWPVVHIDTLRKPKEIYEFRERLKVQWKIPLKVIRNQEALNMGISPEKVSRYQCCSLLKTEALKKAVMENRWDALIISIRHDEHYARGMEDLLSLRDETGAWKYWGHFGGFGLTAPEQEGYSHIRIHPLLPWKEADVWELVLLRNLPVNPLYFAKQAEDGKFYRYRSLGCEPCTEPVESIASSPAEILIEVAETPGLERMGRAQDKESEEAMLKLRAIGYM